LVLHFYLHFLEENTDVEKVSKVQIKNDLQRLTGCLRSSNAIWCAKRTSRQPGSSNLSSLSHIFANHV
jgi:hypothetical protein